MKIQSYVSQLPNELPLKDYDVVYLGDNLDDRGNIVSTWCDQHIKTQISTKYSVSEKSLSLNGEQYIEYELVNHFNKLKDKKILLETTTLGTAELCQLLYFLKESNIDNIDLLYIEPKDYKRDEGKSHLERKFDLSDEINDYSAIAPLFFDINGKGIKKAIFMLGFEGYRLYKLFTHHEAIKSFETIAFIGVPPFVPGFELNTMVGNMQSIDENELIEHIVFCSANNVEQIYRKIKQYLNGLEEQERLIIAPIGTKPMAIAGILAGIDNEDRIGIMYDHPKKKKYRTEEANNWSLYRVQF